MSASRLRQPHLEASWFSQALTRAYRMPDLAASQTCTHPCGHLRGTRIQIYLFCAWHNLEIFWGFKLSVLGSQSQGILNFMLGFMLGFMLRNCSARSQQARWVMPVPDLSRYRSLRRKSKSLIWQPCSLQCDYWSHS